MAVTDSAGAADQFRIMQWNDESLPRMLDLARTTLGAGTAVAKTEDFWRWKHIANPFGRSYGIYAVDEVSHRLASLRLLLPWRFLGMDGEEMLAARAVDTATHADFQRRGLFTRLTVQAIEDLAEAGTALIFNTPNEKSLPGYLKMGWTLVDKRSIYVRPLRPLRMLRRRLGVSQVAASEPADFFAESVMPWHEFTDTYGEEAWRLMAAWEQQRRGVGWRTLRSKAYYAWRYGGHPNIVYHVHVLSHPGASGSSLRGAAVLRANVRKGWQEVVLSDLFLAENSVECGCTLLRSLAASLKADYIAAHFAPGAVEYASIRKCGYASIPGQGVRFTVRPLSDAAQDVGNPSSWDLSLGDLEIF